MGTDFDRRTFLKGVGVTAGVIASGAGGAAAIGKTPGDNLDVSAESFEGEERVPVLCNMCAQRCPGLAVVKDGKVVRMESNPLHAYSGICGRAYAAGAALYNSDRIKTPLRRVGERGEGKFEPISWDEALDIVAGKLKELRDADEEEKAIFLSRFSSAPVYDKYFFQVYGSPNVIGFGDVCFSNITAACRAVLGFGGAGGFSGDYKNTKYALIMGKNLGGAIIPNGWGTQFGEGLREGLNLTVVDPRQPSEMGQAYAEWLPIRPGTDNYFVLGIYHYLFENNYLNESYLKEKSNAAFLIDAKTLLPVQSFPDGEYLVYDASSGQIVPVDEAADPALYGSFSYDGREVKTALTMMKEEVSGHDIGELSRVCGIPEEKIAGVAEKLYQASPNVCVEFGYRFARHHTDFRAQLYTMTLNILLGSFDTEGGVLLNRSPGLGGTPVKPPALTKETIVKWYMDNDPSYWGAVAKEGRSTVVRAFLEETPYRPKVLFTMGQDILRGTAGGRDIRKMYKEIESIFVFSPFYCDGLMYADIVFPDCTFLERDEPLYTRYKSRIPTIGVNLKAVEPLYDSKNGTWILLELAKRIFTQAEYEKYFAPIEAEGYRWLWEHSYKEVKNLTDTEKSTLPATVDELLAQGGWGGELIHKEAKPKTRSGRYEIYSLWLASVYDDLNSQGHEHSIYASPLPVANKPAWFKELADDEFVPAEGMHPLSSFGGAQTKNNPVLTPVMDEVYGSYVHINSARAKKLNIQTGDIIEAWIEEYPEDVQKGRVYVSETVHPDVMFLANATGKGMERTTSNMRHADKEVGINLNHYGKLQFVEGTAAHTPQDVVLKIRRV